jgi:DeoR family transcriptional regulator, suf operon transcriptional repressor
MSRSVSSAEHRSSDAALIELLLAESPLGIGELAARLGVTATAVRQRLDRLMRAGLVGRSTLAHTGDVAAGTPGNRSARLRGRPSHVYSLTDKGRRTGGDNFRDLAMVLWREIRSVREPAVRQGLIARIGAAMAEMYRAEISGETPRQRLESTARILRERQISCSVEPAEASAGSLPVLTSYACPYPDLAEQDRGICAAERMMLQDLVGATVQLSECRLDGGSCCRFTVGRDEGGLLTTVAPCNKPV